MFMERKNENILFQISTNRHQDDQIISNKIEEYVEESEKRNAMLIN